GRRAAAEGPRPQGARRQGRVAERHGPALPRAGARGHEQDQADDAEGAAGARGGGPHGRALRPDHHQGTGEREGEEEMKQQKEKLGGKQYAKQVKKLHVELVKLQEWVKHEGARIVIVFEGRDSAGKGGTIKAISERVSP